MYSVWVCNVWTCASEAYWVYDRIEPCMALAVVLTLRLGGVLSGLEAVCR